MHHDRLVQKLANAVRRSLARQALDQNYIGVLKDANNEAITRQKTKSDILGKAKVMTYEDIVAERTRRETAAQAKAQGRGKCGRPRKVATQAGEGPSG
jgi:hypothetical protein